MGDFNDEPRDQSLKCVLGAIDPEERDGKEALINLMFPLSRKGKGTHFRVNNLTEATVLDQIIVSKAVYNGENQLKIKGNRARIYRNDFLISQEHGRPLRTYQGLKYIGGYSDHLPVYIDLQILD
jgi:hypothetical protein